MSPAEPEPLFLESIKLSTSDLAVRSAPCDLVGRPSALAIATNIARTQGFSSFHFEREELPASEVVLTELLSCRGPAAWLSVSDESMEDRTVLCTLSRDCAALGQLLVISGGVVDLVLVPREAQPTDELCMPFILFLTKLSGVRLMAHLMAQRKVAVMLDLDATLLESEHLLEQPLAWSYARWSELSLYPKGALHPGFPAVAGYVARMTGEPHHAEAVYAATWTRGGFHHSYIVRRRPGWSDLRSCLIQESGQVETYVCSSGRPLYVQLVWGGILDADAVIVGSEHKQQRLNSARPEGVSHVPAKVPGIGFGLSCPQQPEFKLRVGPLFIVDDLPDAWAQHHRDSVFHCEAYRPVVHVPRQADDGSVLREVASKIKKYHAHCYGSKEGSQGGSVAAVVAAAKALTRELQTAPLADVRELNTHISSAEEQGEMLWRSISLESFLASEAHTEAAVAPAAVDKENTAANLVSSAAAEPAKPSPGKAQQCGVGRSASAPLQPSSRQGPRDADLLLAAAEAAERTSASAVPAADQEHVHLCFNFTGETAQVVLLMQETSSCEDAPLALVDVTRAHVESAEHLFEVPEGVAESGAGGGQKRHSDATAEHAQKRRSTS